MATYYKFKDQDAAKTIATLAEIPIITHPHWVFRNPRQSFAVGYTVRNVSRDNDLEEVDISTYPEYITVRLKDNTFYNYPIKWDTDDRYGYYDYRSTPILHDKLLAKQYSLSEFLLPDFGPDSDWSSPMRKYVNHTDDYLKEQIRVRYGMFERPTNGLSNVVVDSFFPRLLYVYNLNVNNLIHAELPSTAVAISPLVANLLNVKQIPVEQLCRALGYSLKDIKALLLKVKRAQINFVFAGAGGTGMNTAYWLREMCRTTNTVNLFKKVWVYDKDTAEMSNLLRFPVDIRTLNVDSTRKIDLIAPFIEKLSNNKAEYVSDYITATRMPYQFYKDRDDNSGKQIRDNYIIYGAPSVESRNTLSQAGGFICATHAATTASVWLNPHQDTAIQVESYGLIQLGGFFMNQLRMAIKLIEILGDDNFNPQEQDKSLLEFEFDGTRQLPTDRTYQWQITPDMLMMTADQAATL